MSIEYVVPPHLEHSMELYERVKIQLEKVLREKPTLALARIDPNWPFDLAVGCCLGGEPLARCINLGSA
jgi:hypothetical protein